MIAFDLECHNGHIFEGWFNNLKSFEAQNSKRMINCPYCNDTKITKVISPVAMNTSSPPHKIQDAEAIDYPKLATEVVDYINKHFDDVGSDFAKEALKMHYDVAEKRNIRGSATGEEEKMLRDEGIEFFKVPIPKLDDSKKT